MVDCLGYFGCCSVLFLHNLDDMLCIDTPVPRRPFIRRRPPVITAYGKSSNLIPLVLSRLLIILFDDPFIPLAVHFHPDIVSPKSYRQRSNKASRTRWILAEPAGQQATAVAGVSHHQSCIIFRGTAKLFYPERLSQTLLVQLP